MTLLYLSVSKSCSCDCLMAYLCLSESFGCACLVAYIPVFVSLVAVSVWGSACLFVCPTVRLLDGLPVYLSDDDHCVWLHFQTQDTKQTRPGSVTNRRKKLKRESRTSRTLYKMQVRLTETEF